MVMALVRVVLEKNRIYTQWNMGETGWWLTTKCGILEYMHKHTTH